MLIQRLSFFVLFMFLGVVLILLFSVQWKKIIWIVRGEQKKREKRNQTNLLWILLNFWYFIPIPICQRRSIHWIFGIYYEIKIQPCITNAHHKTIWNDFTTSHIYFIVMIILLSFSPSIAGVLSLYLCLCLCVTVCVFLFLSQISISNL